MALDDRSVNLGGRNRLRGLFRGLGDYVDPYAAPEIDAPDYTPSDSTLASEARETDELIAESSPGGYTSPSSRSSTSEATDRLLAGLAGTIITTGGQVGGAALKAGLARSPLAGIFRSGAAPAPKDSGLLAGLKSAAPYAAGLAALWLAFKYGVEPYLKSSRGT